MHARALGRTSVVATAALMLSWGAQLVGAAEEGAAAESPLARFKADGMAHCRREGYPYCGSFELSVWQQLFLEVRESPTYTSPEVRGASGFGALEASRSLRRANRFAALFDADERSAYRVFTAEQDAADRLSWTAFRALRALAARLTPDEHKALFASALLKPSKAASDDYAADGAALPRDSEEALTVVAQLAAAGTSHMPIIDAMTAEQRTLLPLVYPADVHVRHALLGEAGLRRIVMAAESLKAGKQTQNLTYWRWLIDLCGFTNAGVTQSLKSRFDRIFGDLCAVADGALKPEVLMVRYLQELPVAMGVTEVVRKAELSADEALLIARLLSFFTEMDAATASGIVEGYLAYRAKYPGSDLVRRYSEFLSDPAAKAPTYTPAVLKTAMGEFSYLGDDASVSRATEYTLHLLEAVHAHMAAHPEERVACRDAAWFKNMRDQKWAQAFRDGRGVRFAVRDAEVATTVCTPEESCARS